MIASVSASNPVTASGIQTGRVSPAGGRFRFTAPTGLGVVVGEVVRFAEEHGKVTRKYTGDTYYDRITAP
jgi:hypothetical protein